MSPADGAAPRGALIDARAAREAVERCAPMLEALAGEAAVNGSGVLHVVVADAGAGAPFDASILFERSFGRPVADWDADYAAFARAKARLSYEYRCDSHALHALAPQRLRPGDSALWGGVWLDGIVVAVSGCEMPYDEAAAGAVAMMLRAHAKLTLSRYRGPTLD